ncbi:MAG: hypothetical protein CFE21_06060 [Bacteroidetes bacterium B1(2017)]|nr:MAG: hypothetical protein CFE21_06060 [Bacteroidetes bacterium B1(2017)]
MDKKKLQTDILEASYQPEQWLEVLKLYFGAKKFHQTPQPIILPSNDLAEMAAEIGSFYTADERLIGIYEVKLTAKAWISKNRVGLRNLLRQVYKYDVDGALIVFVQDSKWRFSYVSEIRTEEGKKETEPKRYTYLFGKGESCRTAADRFDKLKGKPIYINDLYDAFSVEKLNKDFFKTYKEFYEKFWKYLAADKKYYKILADSRQTDEEKKQKPLRDFSKKLLGRIVFLQFLQKKGWMGVSANSKEWKDGDTKFLQTLFATSKQKDKFHSTALKILFFETLNTKRKNDLAPASLGASIKLPYLNGGLFDKDISFENDFDFPVDYFETLLDFFEQYNFTIDENDPYDSEVGIDPEMLGHIFENLLEENREKGAFYTPKEIVHYMCQESLIEYLQTQLPNYDKADFELLVRSNQVSQTLTSHKKAIEVNDKLKAVKVCDPAIGSGAFPMGLLKEIFECRRLLYPYLKTNEKFDPAQVKKDIIQENIYGVDLENGAVEIARLRFWLALVVDETEPQPLPNLDYKIMQGNSLLERFEGVDLSHVANNNLKIVEPAKDLFGNIKESQLKITYTKTEIVTEIQKRMKKFFNLENADLKQQYRNEINELVHEHIEFNFDLRKNQIKRWISELKDSNHITDKQAKKLAEYETQFAALTISYEKLKELEKRNDKPFFLWKLFFADVFKEGGFDIVIGNPPYIQLQSMGSDADILAQVDYNTFGRTGDIYCLFYEQGNNLLKENGNLCFITSNKWMNAAYGKNFRNYLLKETNPTLLIDFSKAVIFPAAVVFVNILQFKKEKNKNILKGVRAQSDFQIGKTQLAVYVSQNSVELTDLDDDNWAVAEKQDFIITKRVDEIGTQLKKWDLNFFRGITSGFNHAFHIDSDTKRQLIKEDKKNSEIIKPLLRGKDIKRWAYHFENLYLINSHNGVRETGKPRIKVEQDYPIIYEHLLQFYDKNSPKAVKNPDGSYQTLKDRADQGDHWSNLRNCAFIDEFEKEKIIWIEISDRANYCLDTEGKYLTNSAYFITGKNLKFLLAILNSRLMDFYFYQKTAQIAGGRKRYTKQYVELLPIPQITDETILKKFEVIVTYMIYLNDINKPPVNPYTDNASIAPVFEDVLNMMVYELYFDEHMKQEEIDVLRYIDIEKTFPEILPFSQESKTQAEIIGRAYKTLQEQESPIRNRMILSNIRSKEIIRRINSTTH